MHSEVSRARAIDDDPPIASRLRERLVARVAAHGVHDARVLEVLRRVPRHLFAPEYELELVYRDHPLTIGHDATISQPTVVGLMSASLELRGGERVLEVGTGSGYQAAVLGRLAAHVDTVEVVPELAARAAEMLSRIGCSNVDVHVGDGWAGWAERAPYDRVIVTAAPEVVPPALLDQLADDGRLVIPIGSQTADQRLERWHKRGAALDKRDLGAVRFVPMVHATRHDKES